MKKSFTLIELLIVIGILGFLSTLIVGNFFTSLKKGRDARRKGDLEQIQRALELYYEDKKSYPTSLSFGQPLVDNQTGKIYMNKLPNDPSSGNYHYESDGNYYKLYACLENNLQILPYVSNPTGFTCNNICKDKQNNNVVCIWGISSSNVTP